MLCFSVTQNCHCTYPDHVSCRCMYTVTFVELDIFPLYLLKLVEIYTLFQGLCSGFKLIVVIRVVLFKP